VGGDALDPLLLGQFVNAELADRWVPQLSSKRPGVVDNGVVWDDAMTLQEYLQLRQRYLDVRLLWSGDWSTFSAPDFWVSVAGVTFADSPGALAWCRTQGFDRDHCVAKIISTTHPVAGSTAYN
jgi:serine/threonine kinase PknH